MPFGESPIWAMLKPFLNQAKIKAGDKSISMGPAAMDGPVNVGQQYLSKLDQLGRGTVLTPALHEMDQTSLDYLRKVYKNVFDVPGGDIDIGSTKWMVSIPGEVQNLEELANIPLGNYLGHLVLLGDVAEMKDTLAEQTMIYRSNQNQSVGILISKQTGYNAVEVSREVMAELEYIESLVPEWVDIGVILNYAENVVNTLENLRNSILVALIAVTLVVLFFLRRCVDGSMTTRISIMRANRR